ncbi:MFS transporter [Pseudomonas sp. dw_358]|uniref:MFS transporter n=1 Tax=Pseudomonas sp. dw_358 TaxID=2720083 RepID=UPI001BD6887E|nr:MFS transporter [Pseudomonas sp. dw_358]
MVTGILWTAFFIINFNVAMMIPLLPFIQHELALSAEASGWILAAFPVVALLSNLALGPLIDRYGRKRFIVIGASACCVTLLATAASHSAVLIVLCRAATGLFMPMIGASIFAAVADYVPELERPRAAGRVTTAAPIAFLCSLSMGVVLGGLVSWQVTIIGLAAVCAALAGLTLTLPAAPPGSLSRSPLSLALYRERLTSLAASPGTRPLMAAYFCWAIGVYLFLGLYPSWLVQHGLASFGVDTIGSVIFVGEVGGLFGAMFSARLARRFNNPLRVCACASLAIAVVIQAVPWTAGYPIAQGAAYMAFAFGRDLMLALILGDAMRLVEASRRGSLNSSLNAVYQTGGTLGGLSSAWLYGLNAGYFANVLSAALAFVASAWLLRGISRTRLVAQPVD